VNQPRVWFSVRGLLIASACLAALMGLGLWAERLRRIEVCRESVWQFADIEHYFREQTVDALSAGNLPSLGGSEIRRPHLRIGKGP
jgi:hypothetical protein